MAMIIVGSYLIMPRPKELDHIRTFEWGEPVPDDVSIWIWNISGIAPINTQVGFEVYKRELNEWS